MNTDNKTFKSQLSDDTIIYLNKNLTKKAKTLLLILYKTQPLQHKYLAETLDMQTNGLSNLISKINKVYKEFITFKYEGRSKFYSLSQDAEKYTKDILLPKEAARKDTRTSFLHTDLLIQDVLIFLKKFQEFEGDDWYIVLDDLLFIETRKIVALDIKFKEETYLNYNNLKDALITLIIKHGKQSVQKIYSILDQRILTKRLDSLLSSILDDYYKIEPLFRLEKKDLQMAYFIIDKIFLDHYPAIFGTNSVSNPNPLPPEYYSIYYSIYSVINNMINEFKNNNYDKAVSIEQWEKKFYTKNQFSCISYIAEKCSTVYISQEKPPSV